MEYRKADSKEHEIISKQIRSKALLYVCLIVPVSPLSLIGMFLSIRMMIRQKYEAATFAISVVFLVILVAVVAFLMIRLMMGFIARISCIDNHKYMVAEGIISGRDERINPKHTHRFVTVSFPDGNTLRAEVPTKVYTLAESGKKALLVKYDEPEDKKKKLPCEAVVL